MKKSRRRLHDEEHRERVRERRHHVSSVRGRQDGTDATPAHGHHGADQLDIAISVQDLGHQLDALDRRKVGKPDQTGVGVIALMNELAEIGVDRHEKAAFLHSHPEQFRITRIAGQRTNLENIVSSAPQPVRELPASTAVDEKSQAPFTRTASMLSLAMLACA
ncbi:MAG TPA: hypothetical protein VFZ01_05245 [Geminicoccaceae bacterium]